MRLSTKHAAAITLLLCLSGLSCARSYNAQSGARADLSSGTPSQKQEGRIEIDSLPPSTGFVNDYANVLDGDSETRLESVLTELRDKSGVEFAVLTIETTGDRPMSEYSLAVAKSWGLGPGDTTRGGGLLLVLATKDRKWRLQVSRSLEKDLPDEECAKLADESVKLYREGKVAEGVTKYVGALVARLEERRGFKLSGVLGDER